MTPPRRVLYLNPSAALGGAEYALLRLIDVLDRDAWQPSVALPGSGPLAEELRLRQVPTHPLPLGETAELTRFGRLPSPRTLLAGAGVARAIRRLVAHTEADLVHTNGLKAHLLALPSSLAGGPPLVWHLRDLVAPGAARELVGWGSRVPRRVIAVSGAVAESLPRHARTRIIHDAVDTAAFVRRRSRAEVRRELGVEEGSPVVLMVAHFTRWKGHEVFLRVLRELPGVHGWIVGGSIYAARAHAGCEDEARLLLRTLELEPRVRILGVRDDVPDLMAAADLLLHPPTQPEPFGLAVLEAMALGLPVVAAAAGGPRETVVHGATGLLTPPEDVPALAAACRELLHDPRRREAMGKAGALRVASHFTLREHGRRVMETYREVLGVG